MSCSICYGYRASCPACEKETTCPDCKGWGYNYEPIEVEGMDFLQKVDCETCKGTGTIGDD